MKKAIGTEGLSFSPILRSLFRYHKGGGAVRLYSCGALPHGEAIRRGGEGGAQITAEQRFQSGIRTV
jgi:hypothetical protein